MGFKERQTTVATEKKTAASRERPLRPDREYPWGLLEKRQMAYEIGAVRGNAHSVCRLKEVTVLAV